MSEQAGRQHHAPTTQEAIEARKREVEGHTGTHGHSVAAWTGVGLCLFGSLVASFAVVFAVVWGLWLGLAIMAASGLVTMALSRAGHGQKKHPQHPDSKPAPVR